jgi:hypothetical protein
MKIYGLKNAFNKYYNIFIFGRVLKIIFIFLILKTKVINLLVLIPINEINIS